MTELTDAQVKEACARFCGYAEAHDDRLESDGWWENLDGYVTCELPNYLHSPDAADELMRALLDQEIPMVLTQCVEDTCRASVFQGDGNSVVWHDAPDWKAALATAVAQMQIAKEAGHVG